MATKSVHSVLGQPNPADEDLSEAMGRGNSLSDPQERSTKHKGELQTCHSLKLQSKNFERLLNDQITEYVESEHILSDDQHA